MKSSKSNSRGGKRPGAGRPPKKEKVKLSVWVLFDTSNNLRRLSSRHDISLGEVLDAAFSEWHKIS